MTSVVVERINRPGDLDGVIAIEEASFVNPTTREWYQNELQRPEVCFIYVIRTFDTPVAGFCAFWRVADQVHINNLAILPALRGHGLGLRLLTATIEATAQMGATSATLEVRQSNTAARRLYAKAEFHEAGVRRNYYTHPVEDALVLLWRRAGSSA